jgi:DNA-binding CsgD family transcriptional regulator
MKTNQDILRENEQLREQLTESQRQIVQLTELLDITTEHLLRKREIIEDTAEEINAMTNEPIHKLLEHLRQLPNDLRSQIRGLDELTEYEKQILENRNSKISVLIEKFPKLTAGEVKVCLYISQHRSNKQIAVLLRLSERTIEVHRKSIRNKMGITTQDSLSNTLLKILTE